MSEDRINLVIDRSRWIRGGYAGRAYLLRGSDGKMCCLGFACLAAGAEPSQILDRGNPYIATIALSGETLSQAVALRFLEVDPEGDFTQRDEVRAAIIANDSITIDEATREAKVAKALSGLGFDVSFTGTIER